MSEPIREQIGQMVLNTVLSSKEQPNSGKWALEVADALLPVVEAIAREWAAKALEDAAAYWNRPMVRTIAHDLRERAIRLRAEESA